LRIVDTVLESATVFIMNRAAAADAWKREKAENLILMLQGAIAAAAKSVSFSMFIATICLPCSACSPP